MPPQDAPQQWNPVAEFKQQWPNAKLSDGDILKNLQDPAKFRSAFPHYTGVTDDEIKTKMEAYSPTDMPAQPKGDTRPSEPGLLAQAKMQIVDPAIAAGQQLMGSIGAIPGSLRPSFSPEELQKGKDLVSSLPLVAGGDPGQAGAYAGAGLRRAGQLANEALGVVSSPFNLATASLQQHIQSVIEPWQNLAKSMYGQAAHLDPQTNRYTTGNEDIDKVIDNVVGAVPFMAAGEALHGKPSRFESDVQGMQEKVTKFGKATDQSTPLGPISETGGQQTHIDTATQAPKEAHAPATTTGASKVADVNLERQVMRQPVQLPTAFPTGGPGAVLPEGTLHPEEHAEMEKVAGRPLSADEAVQQRQLQVAQQLAKPKAVVDETSAIREQKRAQLEQTGRPPASIVKAKSFELPDQIHQNFARMADLSRQADLADSNKQADALNQRRQEIANQSKAMLRQHIGSLDSDQLTQLRDSSNKRADQFDAQSKAIRDLTEATIKNRGVKKEIADMRSSGGPVREMVVGEQADERGILRPVKAAAKPPETVGRGGRSIFDELQGRTPTSEFNNIQITAKPEGVSDEEWASHVSGLQEERQGLKRNISVAVKTAAEQGISLDSLGEAGLYSHIERLKEIEGLLGKYSDTATGRRPNIKPELDAQGAIKAPEALKSWTLARAQLALGAKVNQIPTDEEFFQHADMRAEKGRLYRTVADVAQKVLDKRKSESGAIGEPSLKGSVKRVSLIDAEKVPSDREMLARAVKARIFARTVDDDFPMGRAALFSHDGRTMIDATRISHDNAAQAVLPELADGPKISTSGRALRAMLEKGWSRKADDDSYEVWNLDRQAEKVIELDQLRNGKYGQALYIDTLDANGKLKMLSLEDGWDQRYNSLSAALDAERGRQGQLGRIGGITLAASSTIGGIVGAVAGAHLGHPFEGGAIGWGLGFMTPAIAEKGRVMFNTLNQMRPSLNSFGISMKDWLTGPKQLGPVNPAMKDILDAQQRDIKGPTKSLLTRVTQLPGDVQNKIFDKFIFINDRPGAMTNFLMKGDERGKYFRDLRGKIDVDNSPYVSAWLAAGGGGGMAEAHLLDYKKMYNEAQGKGLVNNVNEYLNLKGYQRVYDVMQERVQEADQSIAQLTQGLKQPNLHVEVEAGMRKALREAKAERQDVVDKLTSKTLVPQPYDPPKIAQDLQALQAKLGPKFNDTQNLAGHVFALNRKVLDMVHDSGIIGDAEYNKYTGRGDEYIPMHRILENIAGNTIKLSSNPTDSSAKLYLRQQNVIKALMGSDRINRDPVIASADANLEAMREVMRNGVIKDYLKMASQDPQGVGSYFKRVKPGYKAGPDEGLVGAYDGGQQHTFVAPSWLVESLKNVSPAAQDVIGKGPLQMFSQVLRKGATMGNLAWSLPNALRHFGDMALMSDAGLKDIKTLPRDAAGLLRDWTKSVYSSITHDPTWQEYMRSGAAYSTLQRMISPEDKLSLDALGFKQKVAHGRLIDVVQDFNASVEDATKMTTFRRLREAGLTEKAAAWETRRYGGGPDFAKQGNLTPAINLASMFFNAHLQYVTRVFAKAAENPGRIAVALGAITGMAMTLNEHNYQQKDDKGNLLMRKVPYTDRENNFVVLTGDTYQSSSGATLPVYYKIPKPSFVKFLYNPIENMLNKVAGHEERSGTQLGLQALGNLSPGQMDLQEGEIGKSAVRGAVSSLNPVIRTPLEEAMNYKTTGFGAPIVPGRELNIDPRFQYGPGTSETAKRIGQGGVPGALAGGAEGATIGYLLAGPKGSAIGGGIGAMSGTFGISPRRAEHIIDTTTAGVGRMATGFVDPFLGGVKQTHMEGPEKLSQTPIAGPVLGRFVSTSIDQQEEGMTNEFYRNAQLAQQPLATMQFLQKNHPDQVPAYVQTHTNELWKGQVATQMQGRLAQILNAQKTVEQNTFMSDKDRADALKNLHEVKMKVLDVFTKVMKPSPQVGQAVAFPSQGQGAPR